MCDVRKSVVRLVLTGLAAGLLAGTFATAEAQISTTAKIKARKQEAHARRETNASRQARIQRTIEQTYSHKYEVFGGGGYLRFRDGELLKKDNQVTWQAAGNYYLNPKLAIVADARGSFGKGNAFVNNIYGVYHPQINEYTFMGGASYRFYAREKVAVSAQALGGIGWGIFSGGSKGIPAPLLGMWQDGFAPAFSVGVSGDYNFDPNFAFRVTPTYVATTFSGTSGHTVQNNLGINAGFIYRFGKQKK